MIYTRISQDRTGEAAGVTRQETDCRALAAARQWTVADIVVDNDTSAAGGKARPGFEKLLTAVEEGRIQVVIAWALDRLTRNRRDTLRLIEACQKRGATIALVRGSDLDMSTPAGRLTADLLAAVARSEIETKADRQTRAALQAAEEGRWVGGRRPFGFEPDGMTVRESEAKAVRDAYEWLLDGVSLRQIAHRWNSAGFDTPQGRRTGPDAQWIGSSVSRCLRKARYAGLRSRRGEIVGPAVWPALVDRDTWAAAQAVMNNPNRRPTRGDQRLLTGLAVCGVCDGPIHAGGGATARGVYRCATSGGHVIRKREPVDEYVEAVVTGRLSRPDAVALFAATSVPNNAELIREADAIRQRLDGLAEAYADGTIEASQLRKGTERLRTALAKVEAEIGPADGVSAVGRQLATSTDLKASWNLLQVAAKREVIRALMEIRIHPPGRGVRNLDPKTIAIKWRS